MRRRILVLFGLSVPALVPMGVPPSSSLSFSADSK
jgi:hypothetical protein